MIGGSGVASGRLSTGDPQTLSSPSPCKTFPYNIGLSFCYLPPWLAYNCIPSTRPQPKSQHCDFAAADAAEGQCCADIDELANLFSRQTLEWGTGFVCSMSSSISPGCPRHWVCFLPDSNFAVFFLSFNLLYSFIIVWRAVFEIGKKYPCLVLEIEGSHMLLCFDIRGFRLNLLVRWWM